MTKHLRPIVEYLTILAAFGWIIAIGLLDGRLFAICSLGLAACCTWLICAGRQPRVPRPDRPTPRQAPTCYPPPPDQGAPQ